MITMLVQCLRHEQNALGAHSLTLLSGFYLNTFLFYFILFVTFSNRKLITLRGSSFHFQKTIIQKVIMLSLNLTYTHLF